MATIFTVDFKNKKLVSKKVIEKEDVLPDQVNLDKLQYFSQLINDGMTLVEFNTKHAGIQIPTYLTNAPIASLNWSYRFKVPDFAFDEDGVKGTLSFNGQLCFTYLPWASVLKISLPDGQRAREWLYFSGE